VRGADSLSDVARRDFVTVTSHTVIFDVLARMQAAHASVAIVLEPSGKDDSMGRVVGIVTKAHLAETLAEGMELFGD
jgi:CBS domain containing-hemolysin-like protein